MAQAQASEILASFANSAETYERRIGRATRAVAAYITAESLVGLPADAVVHDNACGTGAVTDELMKVYPNAHVDATDMAAPMVDIVNAQMRARGLQKQVIGTVMDGANLQFHNDKFDASVTNFGIFFLPEPIQGMKEIHRTLKPGGTAVLTCWESLDLIYGIFGGIEKLIKPGKDFTKPDFLLKWRDRDTMKSLMMNAGFSNVEMNNVKRLFWGFDLDDLAGGIGENMKAFVGDDYTAAEKENCIPYAKEYLQGQASQLLVYESDKVGIMMSAWVAKAVK